MSDDDRLSDYLARMDNPDHRRDLADGCTCGDSIVACNASRYVRSTRCCPACSH
jgi:hypothetical protein